MHTRSLTIALLALAVLVTVTTTAVAQSTPALGIRAGLTRTPNQFYLGMQTELGRVLDGGRFAPSLDFGLEDGATTILNGDVRWYLFRLPETGLRFYGAIGPALVLSPDTELGLNLTAGVHVPMRSGRRYNVEMRFGFGDVPEFKLGAGILFDF